MDWFKRKPTKRGPPVDSNPLTEIYFWLSPSDYIDGRMLCSHALVTGQTGAGKTQSSGSLLLKSHIRCGNGGLVLGSKGGADGDAANTRRYASQFNRERDVVVVTTEGPYRIDALNYIYSVSGQGYATTCNDFLLKMLRIGKRRSRGGGTTDPFWEDS